MIGYSPTSHTRQLGLFDRSLNIEQHCPTATAVLTYPAQDQLRSIKSQQASGSREMEKMIQGLQGLADKNTTKT